MSNYLTTTAETTCYIRARTPLIIINSSERERVERMLREIAKNLQTRILYYTDHKQVSIIGDSNSGVIDIDNDPLSFIASQFKKNRNTVFAFGDVKRIGEDNMYSREVLNVLYLAKETNSTLILITADTIWPRLAQFGMLTSLSYPDYSERLDQLKSFINEYKNRFSIYWDLEDIKRAATLLRGFSEIQIDNIMSTTLIGNEGLFKDHLSNLTSQKSRLYGAVSSIQQVFIDDSLEVSGLDALKSWLEDKKQVFYASDEALSFRDLTAPKGILLAGVPGCGKSFSAKMIAKEWELPLFRFDLGTVYDKWVGESEKKMNEALSFIDNVSPCILWIDEIEKALSVSDSGNDTGKRVLGQFLFWLQESKSKVFLVATANDVSALPFELFRKGRFSEVFFIDLPNESERKAAITQYVNKSLHIAICDSELEQLVEISDGFSYSDIEHVIKEMAQYALIAGQHTITFELIYSKFSHVIPISRGNPDMVNAVRKWGTQRAVSATAILERNGHIYECSQP